MKIVDHRLVRDDGTPYPFVKTPNQGGELKPTYLVMHFTAGGSAKESIGWLANPDAKASAHLVIGKDGSITQMVAFNRVAWHAGKSRWKGIDGLNSHAIGIELDNAGRMVRKGDHWAAETFGGRFPDEQVIVASHKNDKPGTKPAGWQKYPEAQLAAAREVARLLVRTYRLKEVIGHDDISPGRKVDPGPAFPFDSFRAFVMDARPDAAQPSKPPVSTGFFTTTAVLNVRGGAGTQNPTVQGSPLPADTLVQGLEDRGEWKRIRAHESGVTGWVNAKFLQTAPAPTAVPAFFKTTADLNVRSGPGTENPTVPGSPLPTGTIVQGLADEGSWKQVSVPNTAVKGWVAAKFLEAAVPVPNLAGEPAPAS